MAGSIVSSGFASGDRVVVGHWHETPIGPITDVMWAGEWYRADRWAPLRRAAARVDVRPLLEYPTR